MSGQPDSADVFYPSTPLVEAACVAAGPLPSGVVLPLDPAHNVLAPPYYPNGIPGTGSGTMFNQVVTDWGFAMQVCTAHAGGTARFDAFYMNFVSCDTVTAEGNCA